MALSNFEDIVTLSSNTLNAGIGRLVVGSSAGSKSIVFAQDLALASAMHLVASNPTAQRTAILPDANGTLGYLTGFSAGTTAITAGQAVLSNSGGIQFGLNVSTVTARLTTISLLEMGGPRVLANNNGYGPTLTGLSGTSSALSALATGLRISVVYPINLTYIDPMGQGYVAAVANIARLGSGAVTCGGTITWWCGMFTINGSSAGVVSSASKSANASASFSTGATIANPTGSGSTATATIDMRFTNITWNVTPGEYLFMTGIIGSITASMTSISGGASAQVSWEASQLPSAGGGQHEASYTVPYWEDGNVSTSATSFNQTDFTNSRGALQSQCPYIRAFGS